AALRHVVREPGALHRMAAVRAEALDRGHALVLQRSHLRLARADRLAVDVHRAGATQTCAAPEPRAGQAQVVAEIPQQRHLRIAVERLARSIDYEVDHA